MHWNLKRIMNSRKRTIFVAALYLSTFFAHAQATNEIEQLKRQIQQMQENFEKAQREQRQQMDALTRKLEDITKSQSADAEKKKLEQELALDLSKNQPP